MELIQKKIYITKEQSDTLNQLYNQNGSQIIRDLLDIFFNTLDTSKFESAQLAQLLIYKEKSKAVKEQEKRKEDLKEELFNYFHAKNIPLIFARTSKKKARKLCKECILGFREKGYIIPDYQVVEYISEYLEMIERTGLVERTYKKYVDSQTLYYQKEIE